VRAPFLAFVILALAAPAGAKGEFPEAPDVAERRMAFDAFDVVASEPTPSGVAGARKLRLRFRDDGAELEVKWKEASERSGEGWNNVPRKELAAYAIQKWFLPEADYVVPTVAIRCIPIDVYAAIDAESRPTFADTSCVFGALSLWLHGVRGVDEVINDERLARDPVYARQLGNVNLLAYLIQHRDGRESNFLISEDPDDARVFSVDNGIAFGGVFYNFLSPNLSKLRVPVPRASLDRLRKTKAEQVLALGVLAQFELADDGTWVPTQPGPNLDDEHGTRLSGRTLQLGLTEDEIEAVVDRLKDLLEDADEGSVAIR
jgi:hypothetical protein